MKTKRIFVTGGSGFIGTNLIEKISTDPSNIVLNFDLVEPKKKDHMHLWRKGDVRDLDALLSALRDFEPDTIIHLAARTDLEGQDISDYSSNVKGVSCLLGALKELEFDGVAIFTSSMYVCRPGYVPTDDLDVKPHTIYGQSKALGEAIIRAAAPTYKWVITRPTSIWGPWFGVPYADFFNVVLRRKYFHIHHSETKKTYGYVGNTVAQILAIAENSERLKTSTIYLGDWPPYLIREWADEIAEFVPYRIPVLPRFVFQTLALLGDTMQKLGYRFPMTTFRLNNMTTDNVHNLSPLLNIMNAQLPYTREQGNAATIEWLRSRL